MARIPDAEIERIKSEVSVAHLAEARGVTLKRSGDNLIGLCPFHDDREPSLVISEAKNLWHCLGACQAGGTVIDWVMRAERVSFRHAVELLRSDLPLAADAEPVPLRKRLPAPLVLGADDQALLDQVTDYYAQCGQEGPEARDYLAARGLPPELAERFRIGFCNRTLGYRLPGKKLKARAELKEALQRIGVVRESGHEHFRGCVTFPILDDAGHVAGLYGRRVDHHLPPGTPAHWYLPGPHRGVWNLEALAQHKEIILCEAIIDALTFWAHGFHNVTAAYGVEGFTDEHLAAFKRHGTQRVLIAYDRDEAGDRAALKLAERLMAEGIECYRVQFPKGMDANEYAQKLIPAPKSLALVIRKATWLGKGPAPQREPEVPAVADPAAAVVAVEPPPVSPLAAVVPTATPPASPVIAPPSDVPMEVRGDELVLTLADRRYRVRGMAKNLSPEVLRINLLVTVGERYHVDTLDLYSARARGVYVAQAAQELNVLPDVIRHDVGRVLAQLEQLQARQIREQLDPEPQPEPMTADQRAEALALLQAPDLLDRIAADLSASGLVGEPVNKLTAYLAATSRLLDRPLAVIVRASTAAGKSSLMDAVLAMMPEDAYVKFSAMSGQALYYLGETDLKHKILALAEEEGAQRASYALKLLQSEGELTMASTGKNADTGMLEAHPYHVEGPVMLFTTTTAGDLDDELLNRCLVLTVDESRQQTQAIHAAQRARRTLDGIAARMARDQLRATHRNAQRLLCPLAVHNPYADRLSFPFEATRTRRAHEHYLTLIDTIALLHQHQRPVRSVTHGSQTVEYVEVTAQDIAHANALAHEVLGRSLDELPPQTRTLLHRLCGWVAEQAAARAIRASDFRFSRRLVREAFNLGDTQAKVHLARLVDLEYLRTHRTGMAMEYELVYDGQGEDGRPFVPGLIDAQALLRTYDGNRSGSGEVRSGGGRPLVGPRSGGGRPAENPAKPDGTEVSDDDVNEAPKTHVQGHHAEAASYGPLPMAARKR